MLTRNFHQLRVEVAAYVEAGCVAQGSHKAGFIDCLAGGKNSPEYVEWEYGIPRMVSSVAESIFEALPEDEAPGFFAALPDAIQTDGKDLSTVGWKFLAAELRELPTVPAGVQEKIDPVIAGMDLLAEGKKWPVSAAARAYSITKASADATYAPSAAWSAAWAAKADSADDVELAAISIRKAVAHVRQATAQAGADTITSRRRQCATLLRLIKEAPVNTTGGKLMADQITRDELLDLIRVEKGPDGAWRIRNVKANVYGNIYGDVICSIHGDVGGDVGGVLGGTINGKHWQYVETPREKVERLIKETGHTELLEAFNQLEEN